MNETHLNSLSCKNKSITTVRSHNAVRVKLAYLFNSSWSSDWACHRCEICGMLMTQTLYELISACRLEWSCLLWRCHSAALTKRRFPVTTRLAAGFFSEVFHSFTHLHRRRSRISLWNASRISSSWSHFKLIWCKNYTVVASSLNNQPNNQRQPSWGTSVSSVAQKTCFKRILKLRHG